MKRLYRMGLYFLLAATGYATPATAQQPHAELNQQDMTWFSVNTTFRFTDKWGAIGDFHVRRNNFLADPSFYFIRFGAQYWLRSDLTLTLGYGHLWLAPTRPGFTTYSNENRIYQQAQYNSAIGRVSMTQRLRNEQRWREVVLNDVRTGEIQLSNRIRYLLSFTIPVAKDNRVPSIVLADEICMQFGQGIIYNAMDQNRTFLGIRQRLSKSWSFDMGYMLVIQQKATGFQYDVNHTFRWFFYGTIDWRKGSHAADAHPPINDE
jgi:hypothetical protein